MPHLKSGTSQIYYEVHGEGPPVVLMHGVAGNHASWFNQVPAFATRYQVIVFNQRGFGSSTDPDGLGRSAMADDLHALLDHLSIERGDLVAQSMSGGAAIGFTCCHPHRVRSLTLADTVVGFELSPALQAMLKAADARGRTMSGVERVFGPTFLAAEPALVFLYRQIASFNRYDARTVAGRFLVHLPEMLAATGVPVLFIAGAEGVASRWG